MQFPKFSFFIAALSCAAANNSSSSSSSNSSNNSNNLRRTEPKEEDASRRCDTSSCTDIVLNTIANGHRCEDRIDFLQDHIGLSEMEACAQVAFEYPSECGGCEPLLSKPKYCRCHDCTDMVWTLDADGHTCGNRIVWVQTTLGKSEEEACRIVGGDEFPEICGACNPDSCDIMVPTQTVAPTEPPTTPPTPHPTAPPTPPPTPSPTIAPPTKCGCFECTEEVLNMNAEGHSCGNRIDWLQANRGLSEGEACEVVGGNEYPNICGACNPKTCGNQPPPPDDSSSSSLSVLTQNLFWWNLFGQNGGGDIFEKLGQYQPYDIYLFQECDDVGVMRNGLDPIRMQTYQGGRALALGWNSARFNLLDQGWQDVGEDRSDQYYGMRAVAWVRLEENGSGKTILAMSHHGPLPIDTGGKTGGYAVAASIASLVGNVKRDGDVVLLGGDFNVGSGFTTLTELVGTYGYILHMSDWVDHILTLGGDGLEDPPEETKLIYSQSDHRGLKATWTTF